jgi:hypothetical protein
VGYFADIRYTGRADPWSTVLGMRDVNHKRRMGRLLARIVPAASIAQLGLLGCETETVDLTGVLSDPAPTANPASNGLPTPEGTRDVDTTEPNSAGVGMTADDTALLQQPSADADAGDTGCKKIDLLFIVDNSPSMQDEQENLSRSFPDFIRVIKSVLGNSDYQIMVVDTDGGGTFAAPATLNDIIAGNWTCDPQPSCCNDLCVLASNPVVGLLISSCSGTPCEEVFGGDDDPCEGTLGAGRRLDSRGESCGVAGTRRYMLANQPNLTTTFSCTADVGTAGKNRPQPMAAMVAVLSSPIHNRPGGCNEGFLRDDALLVITFITDRDDVASPGGGPEMWSETVAQAKGGAENVVVLGLVGDETCPSAEPAPRLREFVELFPFGSLGSVCAEDYTPFFEGAVTGIDTSCREFRPIIR